MPVTLRGEAARHCGSRLDQSRDQTQEEDQTETRLQSRNASCCLEHSLIQEGGPLLYHCNSTPNSNKVGGGKEDSTKQFCDTTRMSYKLTQL